jgi:AAA+ superfamily predicted ATPase
VAIVRAAVEADGADDFDADDVLGPEDEGPLDHASAIAYVRDMICTFSDPTAIQAHGAAILPVPLGASPINGADEIAAWQQAHPRGIGVPPGLSAARMLDQSSGLPTSALSQVVFGAVASLAWIAGANNGVASDQYWARIDAYLDEIAGEGDNAHSRRAIELKPDESGDDGDEALWQSVLIGDFGVRDVRIGRSGRVQWQFHGAEDATPAENDSEPVDDVMEELDGLVGLQDVKDRIGRIRDFVELGQKRRSRGMIGEPITLHATMTGNPGTGKTTVARILSRVYKSLGVLSRGHLVEVDRSKLVAKYLGQTASRVNDLFEQAQGGMLFIDEAYSLTAGRHSEDYGFEAVDALVKLMEDNRADIAVVFAGYDKEMQEFLSSNPGLKSRVPHSIQFPDYSADELVEILEDFAISSHYSLDVGAIRKVERVLAAASERRVLAQGNARAVRNLFEAARLRHAERVNRMPSATDADMEVLTAADLPDHVGAAGAT